MSTDKKLMQRDAFLKKVTALVVDTFWDEQFTRSCLSCCNFNEQAELCTKYGNQRPPARVIAEGCEGYDNEIPF